MPSTSSQLYVACPHTHAVTNKYTGETLYVPCGTCYTCRMNKARMLASKLEVESSLHQFNLFFTLTYDNDNLPLAYHLGDWLAFYDTDANKDNEELQILIATIRRTVNEMRYNESDIDDLFNRFYIVIDINETCPSLSAFEILDDRSYLGFDMTPPQPQKLNSPMRCFGVVSKRDIQLFNKRLRNYVTRNPDKLPGLLEVPFDERRFRYFVCSEYGPNTFRPHYHGIFFCDSQAVSDAIKYYIYKAWQKCDSSKIDIQYVDGSACKYVSSYVSFAVNLPRLLMCRAVRPFRLASSQPSLGFSESKAEEVIDAASRGTVTRVLQHVNKKDGTINYSDALYPRPVVNRLFPKCRRFGVMHKDINYLKRIYFPLASDITRFFDRISVDQVKDNLDFCDPNYLHQDYMQEPGIVYYQNLRCANAALWVCRKFHYTPDEYIDLLLWFYDKEYQFSRKRQYESYTNFLSTLNSSEVYRAWSSFYPAAMDSMLSMLPETLTTEDILLDDLSDNQFRNHHLFDAFGISTVEDVLPFYDWLVGEDEPCFINDRDKDTVPILVLNKKRFKDWYNIEQFSYIKACRDYQKQCYMDCTKQRKINNSKYAKQFNKQMLD